MQRRSHMRSEAEVGGAWPPAQGGLELQKLGDRGSSSCSFRKEHDPVTPRSQHPCPAWTSEVLPHLDLRRLVYRAGGWGWGYISVALGHLVYVAWLRLPLGESHPDYTPSPVQHLRVCVSLCVPICANLSPAVRNMTPIIPVKPVH